MTLNEKALEAAWHIYCEVYGECDMIALKAAISAYLEAAWPVPCPLCSNGHDPIEGDVGELSDHLRAWAASSDLTPDERARIGRVADTLLSQQQEIERLRERLAQEMEYPVGPAPKPA